MSIACGRCIGRSRVTLRRHALHGRLIAVRAAPVEETATAGERTSRAIEILGSREVCFINEAGEIEQIDVNVEDHTNRTIPQRVRGFASDMLLPDGYPETLTPDYLPYQLWTLPVHVTGWISNSLVTSSLLKAAGLGAGPAGTVAAGAAIKWITKDGIGALGRVLVGSSLARYFDEDPRFWRLVADVIKAGGQALEVATAASPSLFVLLASTGNFAKAAGKGIGRPAFRVIQNHFATRGNVGDVAAREEIWEVTAQLVGLAASVGLLQALDSATASGAGAATTVIGTWATVQAAHLLLRYKALATLELPWVSQRRAVMLSAAFVRGSDLPDVRAACRAEHFALPKQLQQPYVLMNATLAQVSVAAAALPFRAADAAADARPALQDPDASGGSSQNGPSNGSSRNGSGAGGQAQHAQRAQHGRGDCSALIAALDMYQDADYVLLPIGGCVTGGSAASQNGAQGSEEEAAGGMSFVMGVKAGCDERGMGKALGVLQAAWFCEHRREFVGGPEGALAALRASRRWVREEGARFEEELRGAGWDVCRVALWSRQRCVIAVDSSV